MAVIAELEDPRRDAAVMKRSKRQRKRKGSGQGSESGSRRGKGRGSGKGGRERGEEGWKWRDNDGEKKTHLKSEGGVRRKEGKKEKRVKRRGR